MTDNNALEAKKAKLDTKSVLENSTENPDTKSLKRKRDESETQIFGEGAKVKPVKKKHKAEPTLTVIPSFVDTAISISNLRDLVLHLCGVQNTVVPTFMSIKNPGGVVKIVTLMIPGLLPEMFGAKDFLERKSPMEFKPVPQLSFFETFEFLWPTMAPGTNDSLHSPITAFALSPMSKSKKKELDKARQNKYQTMEALELIMTYDQMKDNFYPMHPEVSGKALPLEEGWRDTEEGPSIKKRGNTILGLDCEMCATANGPVVTRATVVDYNGDTIYDKLVKPDEPITDYLTQWSGITKEMLGPVTTTLSDVQDDLIKLVKTQDILVGHSLESDLGVLKLRHPLVIDTSIVFDHPRGATFKCSLKWLATKYLKKSIQTGTAGHDSSEDARTCIELIKEKLKRGPKFGVIGPSGESTMGKIVESTFRDQTEPRKALVVDFGNPQWTQGNATKSISCEKDAEVCAGLVENLNSYDFCWGRFKKLEYELGWNRKKSKPVKEEKSEQEGDDKTEEKKEEEKEAEQDDKKEEEKYDIADPTTYPTRLNDTMVQLNDQLQDIYDALPKRTALIVFSGSGDPLDMLALRQQKYNFQQEFKVKKWDELSVQWTDVEVQLLKKAARKARTGLSFIKIKPDDEEE
ncbi:putative exonuclease [Yarrowia sp. C11]|nr:putative exonuclease [Yarrowia sp. E02]KAG5372701.1 putative exonuclease [Yarrowia sp. C11]